MCSDEAPPPQADPRLGEAAVKQAETGQQFLEYAKVQGAQSAQLGQDYLNFSKDQFKVSQELMAEYNAIARQASDYFMALSAEDRERYKTVYQPIEDQFIAQAKSWDSPEALAHAASTARADVATNAKVQRDASERSMHSMGIAPGSGRYEGVNRALGIGEALGSVDAQNRARDVRRNEATVMRGAAIDMGRGLPASSAASMQAGAALAAGPLAAHMPTLGIMQSGYGGAMTGNQQAAGITGSGYSGAMKGYAGSGSTFNDLYKSQLSAWDSQQKYDAANAAGIGQFAGTAVGAGLMFMSSKKSKDNRQPVPEGKSLDAVKQMPVETYDYKPGMGDGGSHVGPMAEDFAQATGKGDGTAINVQDALGVTMGAVKDLAAKVDRMAQAIGLGAMNKPATA